MRDTLGDVRRHPSRLGSWWYELPARHKWWWREVLFADGGGWLRWKPGTYEVQDIIDPEIGGPWESYTCLPPLRRLARYVWANLTLWRHDLSWSERVTWADFEWVIDPARKELWQ